MSVLKGLDLKKDKNYGQLSFGGVTLQNDDAEGFFVDMGIEVEDSSFLFPTRRS